MEVKFEYLGEDRDFPDAKTYKVEAIHVTTTRNMRKFTQAELESGGRSLSFRPLNVNHDDNRQLAFPENDTLGMEFDKSRMAVVGKFRVMDPAVNAMIETERITKVSIEQIPTKGESCNEVVCEQHGVAFIGMALLENGILPGDENANISKESFPNPHHYQTISSILISDGQRICKECTDFEPCHSCQHKTEIHGEVDQMIQLCLDDVQREHPEMPQDRRVIHCLEQLNRIKGPEQQRNITITMNEQNDCVASNIKEIKAAHPDMKRDQVIAIALDKCGQSRAELCFYYHKIHSEKWQ